MKRFFCILCVLLALVCVFVACHEDEKEHTHTWSAWEVTSEPTCQAKGEEKRTCACGESETREISEKAHTWDAGELITAATCGENGEKRCTCTVCAATESVKIPATGDHNYNTNNVCRDCDKALAYTSTGIVYGESGNTCFVSSVDTNVAPNIVLPYYHNGKMVTSIGSHAFSNNTSITSVRIPKSVGTIDVYAFSGCSSLTSVNIPESVTNINGDAFYKCTALTSVTIPASVSFMGSSAFSGCSSLETVIFAKDSQLSTINSYMFENCTALTSVSLPASVTSIGDHAFFDCIALVSINIPTGVTSLSGHPFYGCDALIQKEGGVSYVDKWAIDCDQDVTAVSLRADTVGIGDNAFYYCEELTSVAIPAGVKRITASMFNGCNKIIQKEGGVSYIDKWIVDCDVNVIGVSLRADTVGIGDDAFSGCSVLASITIPAGVTNIGRAAFYNCRNLTSINIPAGVTGIGNNTFYGCSGLTSITIPANVTSIGNNTFYGCSGLTSINIPANVTSIGFNAFDGCSGLTKVVISDLAAWCKISFAYYDANPLCYAKHLYLGENEVKDLVIPADVTSIGDYAFAGCSALTSVTIPAGVTGIGYDAFSGCSGLTKVVISDFAAWCKISFENYYANPFYYAKHLYLGGNEITNFAIPAGVTSIGGYVFAGCSALTSVTIPASVTSIGNGAFYDCSALTSINIPAGVTSIDYNTFYNCSALKTVTFAANSQLTSIGSDAFAYCRGLTSITIPANVVSIGHHAFWDCSSLESITVASGNTAYHIAGNCLIETASKTLIAGCKESVIPDDGSVTSIADGAFMGRALTSVTIPASVTSIGILAFSGCNSLTSVTFENPNGWRRSSSYPVTSGTHIGEYDLANTYTAATYLRSTYSGYWWERG